LRNQSKYLLPNPGRKRDREMQMSLSEIGAIIVLFQMSHYRTFKDFYCGCVLQDMKNYFPNALSDTRFVACKSAALMMLAAYLLSKTGEQTGLYTLIRQHCVYATIDASIAARFSKALQNAAKAQWAGFMALNCILLLITKVS